jgi:hypothetical protein
MLKGMEACMSLQVATVGACHCLLQLVREVLASGILRDAALVVPHRRNSLQQMRIAKLQQSLSSLLKMMPNFCSTKQMATTK